MLTQLPRVPSLIPSSLATRAIGREVSITIFTASSRNSGEKLFFGRGNYFTFPDIHPNGWTVRKPRGTPHALMLFTEFPEQRELLLADFEKPDRGGGRGDRALRLTGPVHAADPDPGLHHERAGLPRGRQGGAVLLLGQPRRGGIRRPRTVRHHPLTEPARGIRRGGPALLPRCPPRPPGAHRHAARAADPGPRYHGRRTGPATVQLRQRHQAAALPIRRLTTRS